MCRMFAYSGNSKADLNRLVRGLAEASRNDPIAEAAISRRCHQDGWGFVMSSELGIAHFRSGRSIFEEEINFPEPGRRIRAIFHARLAFDQNLAGNAFAQPIAGSDQESLRFIAHNGTVDSAKLSNVLGFHGRVVDSELAVLFMAGKPLSEAASELEGFTLPNSALNLLILEQRRDGDEPEIFFKHFYNKQSGEQDRGSYYDLYAQELEGGTAVFSSTFREYGFSGTRVENNDLTRLS